MKTLRFMTCLSAVALLASASGARAADESPYKFEFHGFVTGSVYYQDNAFANAQGQGLLLAAPSPAADAGGTGSAVPKSGSIYSGDIRNTRFAFGLTGPSVLGGTPRAYIESDFFGQYGQGTFGANQQIPRLRVAIAELKLGTTLIQVGQQNQLVVPQIPASIVHIANPVTYGAGTIGWRTPGVRVAHTVKAGTAAVEVAAEVVKNNWADAAQTSAANLGNQASPLLFSLGESGIPMVQARIKADGKAGALSYSLYAVGVYHQVNLKGFGDVCTTSPAAGTSTCQAITNGKSTLTGYVGEVGGKIVFAPVTVAVNAYTGTATGNMLGSIVQFGDIQDTEGFVNVGVDLTKEFSIWGLYGLARPDKTDVRKWGGTRLANDVYGGMIRYASKGYMFGVEGYQNKTKYSTGATTDKTTDALQVIASAGYFF